MMSEKGWSLYREVYNKVDESSPEYLEYRRRWNENPKNHVVENFPIHLDLEATTHCNLRCPFCFQSWKPYKPEFLKLEWFKKAIDEGVSKGLCSIKLQFRGEPLLHPQLPEMVKYAKDRGVIEVMFNTNATLLTEKKARELIDAGLDKLICSVDGYEKEFYEKNRVGAKFEIVLENIKRLQRMKKELGRKKPYVRVQMLDTLENHPHIQGYIDFWSKIVDHVAIEGLCDYHEKNLEKVPVSKEFICEQPWQRLFVLANGNITLCCGDQHEKLVLGHISKDNLADIWTGKTVQNIRDLHLKGESHKVPLCATCDYRNRTILTNQELECEAKDKKILKAKSQMSRNRKNKPQKKAKRGK